MGRPAKKRKYAEAKAERKGQLQAELEYRKKKSLLQSSKEHIGKMIDNTSLLDVAAVAAGTVMIHGLILVSPELKSKALTFIPIGILGVAGIPYTILWQELFPGEAEPLKDELPYWIAAFFIAMMLVKFGGQILSSATSLTGIISTMLA